MQLKSLRYKMLAPGGPTVCIRSGAQRSGAPSPACAGWAAPYANDSLLHCQFYILALALRDFEIALRFVDLAGTNEINERRVLFTASESGK